MVEQSWSQKLSGFPASQWIRVPLGPLISVTSLNYLDADGAQQSFTAFHEVSDAIGPMLVLEGGASWPTAADRPDAVTLTWTCGYGDAADDVPQPIRTAALLLIGNWFANREASTAANMSELPMGVQMLLEPHRAVGL